MIGDKCVRTNVEECACLFVAGVHIAEGRVKFAVVRDDRRWLLGHSCGIMHVVLAMSVFLALSGSDASYNPGPDWVIPPILVDLLPLLVEVGDSARTIPLGVWPLPQEAMPTLGHLVTKLDSVCDIWASARGEATSTPLRNCHTPDISDKEECSSLEELDTSREVSKGDIDAEEGGSQRSRKVREARTQQGYTPLQRGNKSHWIGKMGEIFSRSPNRIASAVRGYIETLPKDGSGGRCATTLSSRSVIW